MKFIYDNFRHKPFKPLYNALVKKLTDAGQGDLVSYFNQQYSPNFLSISRKR